jgi:apolipoprotein N-acyltransferase
MWHYAAFVLWNAFTTFWVCWATVGGGIFAVLANALQMSVVFGLFRLSKKKLQGPLPYLFLATMWIAWERAYFSAQISWPWLVLGNAFARSTGLAQWYEYTGSLGGSLWIWACNLAVFGFWTALRERRTDRWNAVARIAAVAGLLVLFAGPAITSAVIGARYQEVSEGKMDVLVCQPNLDPYQKFQFLNQSQQNAILMEVAEQGLAARKGSGPLLVVAPETFTNDIVVDSYETSPTWRRFVQFLGEHPGTEMLFGASSSEYYFEDDPRDPCDYRLDRGGWVQRHNSALTLLPDGTTEIFHKSKLVVGTEMTPFPKVILPLARLLGTAIGRLVGQPEVTLLHAFGEPFGCAVCYESVYGEYCTEYARKGAKFLAVITNDAWWGNTPGYRQHLSYSSLRAIELRRDVARCGNTGISCFIDQKGRVLERGPWWEKAFLEGTVNFNSKVTFFAEHGDIVGRVCTFAFLLLLLAVIVRFLIRK